MEPEAAEDSGQAGEERPSATPLPIWLEEKMGQEGALLFDTVMPGVCGNLCLFAENPVEWLKGNLWNRADFCRIERWLEQGRARGWSGGLAGAISYEGDFTLGVYPSWSTWSAEETLHDLHGGAGAANGTRGAFLASVHAGDSPGISVPAGEFALHLEPQWSKARFCGAVERLKEHIFAGDVYQGCLCYPWEGTFSGSPWAAYKALREISPAPMSACLHLPGGVWVLSASMERFLLMDGCLVETRPIKGTRPRSLGSQGDIESALLGSHKERAELTMITDLERNDLGQVCAYGSVWVLEHLRAEHYAQVSHLVSIVRGRLREGVSHVAALQACFPGGSISGAPKKRAREILASLEQRERGIYTGAIGYFGFRACSQWNIAIRTLVIKECMASYGVGAGIVADSVPEHEWEETLAKAGAIVELMRHGSTARAQSEVI